VVHRHEVPGHLIDPGQIARLGAQGVRHLADRQPGGVGLVPEDLLHRLRREREAIALADGAQRETDPQPLLHLGAGVRVTEPRGERFLLLRLAAESMVSCVWIDWGVVAAGAAGVLLGGVVSWGAEFVRVSAGLSMPPSTGAELERCGEGRLAAMGVVMDGSCEVGVGGGGCSPLICATQRRRCANAYAARQDRE